MDHLYADNDLEMLSSWVERDFDRSFGTIGAQIEVGNEGQQQNSFSDLLLVSATLDDIRSDSITTPEFGGESSLRLANLNDVYFDGSEYEIPLVLENSSPVQNISAFSVPVQEVDADFTPTILQDVRSHQQFVYHTLEPPSVMTPENIHRIMTFQKISNNLNMSNPSSAATPEQIIVRKSHFLSKWIQLQSKAEHMDFRTGSRTRLKAVFENKSYVWEKKNVRKTRTRTESNQTNSGGETTAEGSEADDDHRYAAVILTQKESSPSVRDHQYNETSFTEDIDIPSQNLSRKPRYIKEKCRRDRQLTSLLKDLFLKKNSLQEMTGASITVEVTYEGDIFTKKNFERAEDLLSKKRRSRRVLVIPTTDEISSCFDESSCNNTNPKLFVSVKRTPVAKGSFPSVQVHFLKKNEYDSSQYLIRRRRPSSTPIVADITSQISYNNPTAVVTSSAYDDVTCRVPQQQNNQHTAADNFELPDNFSADSSEITSVSGPPSISASMIMVNSPQEEAMLDDDDESSCTTTRATLTGKPTGHHQITKTNDAWTITEPICQVCYSNVTPLTTSNSSSSQNQTEKLWLRCFNSLCHYMIHPVCIGFQVHSSHHLNTLPPYFCPQHR